MAWSEEQKKAASDRAKARHLAQKEAAAQEASQKITEHYSLQVASSPAPDTIWPENHAEEVQHFTAPTAPPQPTPTDYAELLTRIKELEQRQWSPQTQTPVSGPQVGTQGLIGTYEKYKTDKKLYGDPRTRLSQEQKLQRFAFPHNYELGWDISVSSYKTIDGINTKEPKFTIELHRIIMDENTGEPTNGRYTICRGIFHEDPDAALTVARDNGYTVEDWAEAEFLEEMRYLRIRDWLLEAFYPPKSTDKHNKKEMVIEGKLVDFFEINSEQSETIPFNQLKRKF